MRRHYFYICILVTLLSSSSFSSSKKQKDPTESIKLGLLLTTDPSKDALCRQAAQTVELAISQVNKSGGIGGRKIELFIKSCDGNWGAGSKQAVSLIYEDGVHALIGFVDGRTAHLIEQVCTKAQIPFMSTLSPDQSLSKINIPWFFSSIPDAEQQAEVLIQSIFQDYQLQKVSIIQSYDYDATQFKKVFYKQVEKGKYPAPTLKTYRPEKVNFHLMIDSLSNSESEGVIFFGDSQEAKQFLSTHASFDMDIPLYFPITELDGNFSIPSALSVYQLIPANWNKDHFKTFQNSFQQAFTNSPGISSAFIYDGTNAILEAIKKKGTSPDSIREGLLELQLEGITGIISFHSSGKTQIKVRMTRFEKKLYTH